jgi:hypothetical protein
MSVERNHTPVVDDADAVADVGQSMWWVARKTVTPSCRRSAGTSSRAHDGHIRLPFAYPTVGLRLQAGLASQR